MTALAGRRAALPPLLAGLAGLALLAAPGATLPGHRGALALADGFRQGRWDARFVVARSPASIGLPDRPLRVRLALSGPARARVAGGGAVTEVVLGGEPSPVDLDLPAGGRVLVEADAAVRLHELAVSRSGPPPWERLAALFGLSLAAALLALRWSAPLAPWAAAALVALGTAGLATGTLAEVAALALRERGAPLAGLALVAASFLIPRLAPRGAGPSGPAVESPPLAWLFAAAMLASCLIQVFARPQPLLLGDPQAYHEIAGRFRDALAAARSPDGLADALLELRPYGGLWLLGLVYGALRGLLDRLETVYVAHALALGGAQLYLVRAAQRLGGVRLGVIAGALALAVGTFPVLAGIAQPEPFILLLWTLALDTLLAAGAGDARRAARAGLAFGAGLALHPQGLWFLLLALLLALLPFARLVLAPGARRLLLGFAVGVLPVAAATAAGEAYARPVAPVLDERHGFWAYTSSYPLGFWLFLDSDGWGGPQRVDDTRYARELRAAGVLEEGRLAQLAFTAGFVARNPELSLRTVLRNLHRLFRLPDNPPRTGHPIPYSLQVILHGALVILAGLGVALVLPGRAAVLYLPVAMLAMTYPLYHVFSKYAVPALPSLLLGASLAVTRLLGERPRGLLLALAAAALGATLPPAALAFADVPPPAARAFVLTLLLSGLLLAFLLAARKWARPAAARLATAVAAVAVLAATAAAEWGDAGWRTFHVGLERPAEHEIVIGQAETAALSAAREAYLALDLRLPGGDPAGLELRFGSGLVVEGRELQPCMPGFGLATLRFRREPREFRQWWRLAWRPEMASAGRLQLTVRGPRGARLFGRLRSGDPALDAGPSLGNWPHLSVYRLMYEGEYRLDAEQPLLGVSRASRHAGAALPGLLGVRVLRLAEDAALARVATAPVPHAARAAVTAVWARVSRSGPLALETPAGPLRFRFEDRGVVARSGPAAGPEALELRFVPTGEGEGEGWYVLRAPAAPGKPLELAFRPFQEMAMPPRFFTPALRAAPPLPLDWTGFPYVPVTAVLESRSDPWRPAAVF